MKISEKNRILEVRQQNQALVNAVQRDKKRNGGKVSKEAPRTLQGNLSTIKQMNGHSAVAKKEEKEIAYSSFVRGYLRDKNAYDFDTIEEAVMAYGESKKSIVRPAGVNGSVMMSNQRNINQEQENDDMASKTSGISDLDFSIKTQEKEVKAMNFQQMMDQSKHAPSKVLMMNQGNNPLAATNFDELILLNKDINNIRPHIKLLNEASNIEVPAIAIVGDEVVTGTDVTLKGQSIRMSGVKDMLTAEVSETVMELSNLDISEAVNELLRIKLSNQELQYLLGAKTSPGGRDFNIFSASNSVEVVINPSIIDGIDAALEGMNKYYKLEAKVVMTRDQYRTMTKELAALNLGSLAANPERYLGIKEIIINDDVPDILIGKLDSGIVGNLSVTDFAVKKNVDEGIYNIALSYLADYKIIKEALRILKLA